MYVLNPVSSDLTLPQMYSDSLKAQ